MTAPSGQAALNNARQVNSYPPGYCLKYVRAEAWRVASLYGSAIDAWHGAVDRHPGDRTPPLGAPMFYSGGQYGHIVINTKANATTMRSTDCQTSGDVSETDIDWPVRNWGQTYLGWTGDLNGVDLPLGTEDDMQQEDFERIRDIVRDELNKNNPEVVDKVWSEPRNATNPDGQTVEKSMASLVRQTWERVVKGLP